VAIPGKQQHLARSWKPFAVFVIFKSVLTTPNRYYRISAGNRPPLRIGLLLDSIDRISAFFARNIEDIQASNFAKIELLILKKSPDSKSLAPPKRGLSRYLSDSNARKHLFWNLYQRFDARGKSANDPLAVVDGKKMLAGIKTLEVEPEGKKFVQRFPAEAIAKIRAENLDVLVRFGFNILRGEILQAARYGVWSYHHGDNEFYRGGPAHFWELVERSPQSGVILQVLTEELDAGLVLCKSVFATERTLRVSQNRETAYWGSSDLLIRKLNELHRSGWDHLQQNALPAAPYQGKRKIYKTPSNRDMLFRFAPLALQSAVPARFRRKTVQHWRIAIRLNGKPLLHAESEADFAGFRWIDSPPGHFWADPFLLSHEGRNWIFFEDYSYQRRRAVIACSEISARGELSSPRTCLQHPSHHYSYPYVFAVGSDIFMIPESLSAKTVDLFRCRRFPDDWIYEKTLLEGKFVDSTVWQHEGLWWLATTSAEPTSRAGSLVLFVSNTLTGEWQFHPANPLSTDIRNNRGAGRIIASDGRLIRPSQSCAPSYGYSFAFNEITELSPQRYSEKPVQTITPAHWKGIAGVHTYNAAGNIEVIDGRTPVPLKNVSGRGNRDTA